MEKKRRLELLAYATVCFKHCTNPFETVHLSKKKVTADECKELSNLIAEILEDEVYSEMAIAEAEKDFAENKSNSFWVRKQNE